VIKLLKLIVIGIYNTKKVKRYLNVKNTNIHNKKGVLATSY